MVDGVLCRSIVQFNWHTTRICGKHVLKSIIVFVSVRSFNVTAPTFLLLLDVNICLV